MMRKTKFSVAFALGSSLVAVGLYAPEARADKPRVRVDVDVTVKAPKVPVTVNVPNVTAQGPNVAVTVPDVRLRGPGSRPPAPPSSGVGLIISSSIMLGLGGGNLFWGIDRVRKSTETDALGVVVITLNSVNIVAAIPLLIVGIVNYATYDRKMAEWKIETEEYNKEHGARKKKSGSRDKGPWSSVSLSATPDGLALHF